MIDLEIGLHIIAGRGAGRIRVRLQHDAQLGAQPRFRPKRLAGGRNLLKHSEIGMRSLSLRCGQGQHLGHHAGQHHGRLVLRGRCGIRGGFHPGQIFTREAERPAIRNAAQGVALGVAHAQAEHKAVAVQLGERSGGIGNRNRLIRIGHYDAGGDDQPLGLAQQIRGKRKTFAAQGLGKPQGAIAELFDFTGEPAGLFARKAIQKGKNAGRSEVHTCSCGLAKSRNNLAGKQLQMGLNPACRQARRQRPRIIMRQRGLQGIVANHLNAGVHVYHLKQARFP